MAEITFDEIKQALGDLYIELVVARRENQKLRESSQQLLEATRPKVMPDVPPDAGADVEPLPPMAIRRKGS